MKIMSVKYWILISLPFVAMSCGKGGGDEEERQQNIIADERQQVETALATKSQFSQELVSNGKLSAGRFADLYWEVNGTISDIYTANGRTVSQGAVVARLQAFKLKNQMESSEAALEQSKLQMKEALIGQGYSPDDPDIPENIRHLAEVKSGYLQSLASYNSAKYDYEHTTLKAPFAGVVANLSDKPSNLAQQSKPFCRIIDQNSMTVDFTIIESELSFVKTGQKVEISVFSMPGKSWQGEVTEVNPTVESNGMVRVKAKIFKPSQLFEGMNVSVKISQQAGEFVSVPKSAVVMRSNRPVVFTAKDHKAHWCYVETSIENSTHIAIISGINEGDSVVVSGNTYLADRSDIIY